MFYGHKYLGKQQLLANMIKFKCYDKSPGHERRTRQEQINSGSRGAARRILYFILKKGSTPSLLLVLKNHKINDMFPCILYRIRERNARNKSRYQCWEISSGVFIWEILFS